jgi:hypothetical protein
LAVLVEELRAKHAYFETVAARLEALELRQNPSIKITAEKSLGGKSMAKMKRSRCPYAIKTELPSRSG